MCNVCGVTKGAWRRPDAALQKKLRQIGYDVQYPLAVSEGH